MSRDPTKLKVFQLADDLVLEVYSRTRCFPSEERYGLQSQIRRAVISVPTNLVEGCARRTTKDYLRFVEISLGSASEARYLLNLAHKLGFLGQADLEELIPRFDEVIRSLQGLLNSLTKPEA